MLTADARRARRPLRAAGRAARRGRRRRRAQAQPRLQPDPRERARLRARRPTPRPTTSSRPAAPASRRRSSSPTRSPSARSTSGIAGGVDTTSDAPIAVNEDLRQVLLEANRAKTPAGRGCKPLGRAAPAPARARDPAQRRAAHRPVDGRARGDHRQASGASPARRRTSSPPPATSTSPPPTSAASSTTSSRPYLGLDARPEPAPRLDASRSSRKLKPVFGEATARR